MTKWLFSGSIVRAYVVATLASVVPIMLIGLSVAFYVGTIGGSIDKVETQTRAAQVDAEGRVPPEAVTARPNFNNVVPEMVVISLILTAFGGIFIRVALGSPTMAVTKSLIEQIRAAAGGDLRVEPEVWYHNDYGAVQQGFAEMLQSFRTTIRQIDAAGGELKAAAAAMAHTSDEAGHAIGEVAQAISSISEGAGHQVDLITHAQEVVATIEDAIRDASEHAREAQRQSVETEKLSEQGVDRAGEVQEAMHAVRETSLNTADVIRKLGEKSSNIDQIVQAITDIAAQTNMLALNASIEAARAGDGGKGFANVAEEVRLLAEDAQGSAEEIAALVHDIQVQTQQAVQAMEDGVVRVEQGFDTVNRNHQTFYDISGAIRQLSESSSEINELADGIMLGAGQVRAQIEEVASVAEQSSASTEQVSASTEQTSAAAQEVSASAQRVAQTAANLSELAGRFKVGELAAPPRASTDENA